MFNLAIPSRTSLRASLEGVKVVVVLELLLPLPSDDDAVPPFNFDKLQPAASNNPLNISRTANQGLNLTFIRRCFESWFFFISPRAKSDSGPLPFRSGRSIIVAVGPKKLFKIFPDIVHVLLRFLHPL